MDGRNLFQQWLVHLQTMTGIQEQIAASHEFDGVRKEKERLTAASLKTRLQRLKPESFSLGVSCHILVSGHILVFLLLIPETND